MKKIFVALFALLPALSFAKGVEFVEYDLDNGLHVILSQDHTTPNVVVSVMYHVGSKNEDPQLTGFAHFFEHLMFEGTENIPRHTYDKYVSDAGGELNANTDMDRTYYFELLPSNYLELGLWLESERMLHPRIEEIGVKTQKDVVCQEMGQTRDNVPYGRLFTEILGNSFKVHPYYHDVLGSEEHVRNASIEDFKAFHDMFYVPDNAVLTICGDFDLEDAKAMVSKYFGDIPSGNGEFRRPDPNMEPRRTAPVKDTVYDNIQLPMIVNTYRAPAYGSDDMYALSVFSAVLSAGNTSRFYKNIVDEQLALQVSAEIIPMEHPGVFAVLGIPNMNVKVEDLEKAIDEQLYGLLENGMTDEEFQKVMNKLEVAVASSNSTIEEQAMNLALAYTYLRNTNAVNEDWEKYSRLTKEDVINVAKKYIVPQEKVSIYFLPKTEDAKAAETAE